MPSAKQLMEIISTKYGRITVDFCIITFIAVIVFRNFLFTVDWPAGGDVLGWISRKYLFGESLRWLYLWRPHSFGFVEGINLMDLFFMLAYSVCRDAATTIKIFMFSSFLVAGFSMYAFAYHFTRRNIAALSASLIYTLNRWFFTQLTEAHVDIMVSYAFTPILFLLLDKALRNGKRRDSLLLTLGLTFFLTAYHPECVVIYGVFILLFLTIYVTSSIKDNFRTCTKHFLNMAMSAGICFLLSAFFTIPFIVNVRAPYYSPEFAYPLEDINKISYRNVKDAFTLGAVEEFGYIFIVSMATDLSLPDFPISIFLLCLFFLAYCTILLRRDRYTIFFMISAIIAIFMSKGPYPPFGYIFTWAWFNVPHFAVFRASSRWIMMVAFSHSFFISILVSIITNYARKRRHLVSEVLLRVKTDISESAEPKEIYVSLDLLNKVAKGLHKFLYYFGLMMLISIFLSGFFSCWFFFSQGLQTYTPPQSHMEPYEWIAKQPGDYRIVPVNRSPGEWREEHGAVSDFGFSGMLTDIGWGHEIGFDSSFIHDKPVLQDGGWEPLSHAFVDHLRFRLAREYMTDDLLKILGTLNYKYVVIPPYASEGIRNFFLNQIGKQIIRNQSSIIIQNEYYTPRIFAPAEHVVVVGGLESFSSLCKIASLNLNQTTLIFAHQTSKSALPVHTLLNSSKSLIFVNSEILDIVMLSLRNDANLITAARCSVSSINHTKYWIRSSSWRQVGALTLGGDTLTTSGKNRVDIPFKVGSDGTYDIWIRVGFTLYRGKLSISIDGDLGGEIRPHSDYWSGLRWVNITRLELKSGDHIITLTNDGTGWNDVDAIAIVKPSQFQSKMQEVLNVLQSYSGRLIYVLGAENAFTYDPLPSGWSIAFSPYNCFMLHTEGLGSNISPEGKASASSVGTWYNVSYVAHGANDGMLDTRWASKPPEMPQWLQIEWATPQKLVGVHILFERAFAKDYAIQTWNGANWVDQVNVTGNILLERSHYFPPVQTTKLRIYVTSAPAYDLVSIWELEAYTTPWVSTKVSIPREGRYMLALRLASGPDYGTLNLRVNDFTAIISCNSSIPEFKWYEVGPVYLQAGDQTIAVGGMGKIEFDQMIIYSLTDGEDALSVNDLFKPSSAPYVSYERINPCEYKVHIKNSEGPFLLVFSESYHPMWRAYIGDVEVAPIIAYSLVNGFFINQTGDFDITLYFTGQTYADIGLKISTITLIGVVAYLTIQPAISRVRKKRKAEAPRVADKPS